MGESRERDGFFGKYTEHFDDDGNKIGESRERDGFFGKYTEHTDTEGNKSGESRERDGFFGKYTEHTDSPGSKTGESRERDGFFGRYTEHVDAQGNKVGESRERDGFFGRYTEHTGLGWRGSNNVSAGADSTSTNSFSSSSGYGAPLSGATPSDRSSSVASFIVFLVIGLFLVLLLVSFFGRGGPPSSYETRSHKPDVSISHQSPLRDGGLSSRGIPARTSPDDEKALAKDFDDGQFENK
ncbi:MAG: hypothetical protein KAU60_08340 [Desulfobacterales bacterium]|nr:hypothetical protein [Desulfobacterales bacterium]